MKNLNEKTEIKRKYREYSAIHVLESAPVRNSVIEFVGKRFITEEELKNFVNSLKELNTNGSNNQSKWLRNNTRYFESVENRGQNVIKLSKFGERILERIVKAKSQVQSNSVNEGRSQVKRKYGEYSNIRVNEKAPIRNKIINFVGKKFVTETEMQSELTKITEEIGKEFNRTKWFKNNQRYFESFENRGQKVWTLSKYGKRVHEFINKPDQTNKINEMKNILSFEDFMLESSYNNELETSINEGTLAAKSAPSLDTVDVIIDEFDDKEVEKLHLGICKILGEDPSNVCRVDSESADEDITTAKVYNYLSNHLRGNTVSVEGYKISHGEDVAFDDKLNVVRYDDNGFVAFFFTPGSKF